MSSLSSSIAKYIPAFLAGENAKLIRVYTKKAKEVFALEQSLSALTDDELKSKSLMLKADIISKIGDQSDSTKESRNAIITALLDEVLPLAFALVREASFRALGMKHYEVQVIGGILLHKGHIAEMRTGEGKTLTSTLPVYLNALTGLGVHVVTVNDYLSRRDAAWMGQIYSKLGLSVAVLNHQSSFMYDESSVTVESDIEADETGSYKIASDHLSPCQRQAAYRADITYGTNNEFGFDYLRDNIGYNVDEIVQPRHHFAIVDEIDSILIDEARTPLIISSPAADGSELYKACASIASVLVEKEHYTVDEKQRAISLTDSGITRAEELLGVQNIYSEMGVQYVHHIETAVKAKALFNREKEYVVKDGEVIIVDEFTGRLQPGRRWSDGIHQAVEAKEGVKIEQESRTLASITYQNFFRFYDRLAGMTGTAETSSEEFYKVYGLAVTPVPTHHPIKRIDHTDAIFQSEKGKWKALAKKVKELHSKGQPVLIGTISIEKNEQVSEYLKHAGVPHVILNAKNHEKEGEIIASAGKLKAVTIATNMAGRGVDIKLGGPDADEASRQAVINVGGLFVIGTERHEARRIDNQLRGRSGRQGDIGETQFYVSLEDDLMRIFGSDKIKNMMGRFGIPEDEPLSSGMVTRALESAQEKIEGFHFDSRKHTLSYDDVLNKQRESIYEKRRRILKRDDSVMEEFYTTLTSTKENILDLIKSRQEKYTKHEFNRLTSLTFLQLIDMMWVDHLDHMESLRHSVNLRAYGQRDPLIEYKREALRMFKTLGDNLASNMCHFIEHIDNVFEARSQEQSQALAQAATLSSNQHSLVVPKSSQVIPSTDQSSVASRVPDDKDMKAGRNDKCPCGSGSKVKKCNCVKYASLRN